MNPPDGNHGDHITFSPWIIDGDDVVRQYNLYNAANANDPTIFQVGCTVEMGSFGFLRHHVFFALKPGVIKDEGFLTAFLATIDDSADAGFFPIQVATCPDGSNMFLIREQQYADKCLSVLGAGKPMRFLLIDVQECIVKLPLDNDLTFRAALAKLQNAKVGR